MITAIADKIIIEDLNHRKWIIYAMDGVITHRKKIYKNYKIALDYANGLMHYYQMQKQSLTSNVVRIKKLNNGDVN